MGTGMAQISSKQQMDLKSIQPCHDSNDHHLFKNIRVIGRPFKFNVFPKVQTFANTYLQLWANSIGKEKIQGLEFV